MAKNGRSIYDRYGYSQINGKWYYGKREYDAGKKSYEFIRYGRYTRKMIYIDEMPIAILKVIWPGSTEEIIEEMFRSACCDLKNLYPNEFSLSNSIGENAIHELKFFVRSWLYKQIKAWNESETYHLNIETKKCLFSFEMGI